MPDADRALAIRYAVRSDVGLHRDDNEDAAYAGARLLAVADGMGGHAGGEVAAAAAIEAIRPLLRNGELFQITHDHTMVQSLIDDGRITAEEAASHPQRQLLLQALGSGGAEPDLQLRDASPGDRYLLCSDGLCDVVPAAAIGRVLTAVADPDQAAGKLIELANEGGGPDNITCIVADVVGLGEPAASEPDLHPAGSR